MQATTNELRIRVGEEKVPITLTDSAVEAVQEEAAGKAVDAFAGSKPTAIDMFNYYMIMGPQHRRELVAELERQAPVDEDARVALQRIREQWPT